MPIQSNIKCHLKFLKHCIDLVKYFIANYSHCIFTVRKRFRVTPKMISVTPKNDQRNSPKWVLIECVFLCVSTTHKWGWQWFKMTLTNVGTWDT